MALVLNRDFDPPVGVGVALSPLVARVLAPNPGPFTFRGTGVYVVGAGDSVAVIDPGPDMPEHIDALKQAIGARLVSHILVTHTHRDHSPAAAAIKAWSGAKTYGFGPAPVLPEGATHVDEAHDHLFAPDVTVTDGMEIAGEGFTLTALHTPGHVAGHVCYALKEEEALFCGDHVMGWSTSVIAPPDGNMGDYMKSLERLIAREDRVLYPTHGAPVEKPNNFLRKLLVHRRARETQVLKAVQAGDKNAMTIAARLYPAIAPSLRAAAATQVTAHLVHLVEQGLVTELNGAWR